MTIRSFLSETTVPSTRFAATQTPCMLTVGSTQLTDAPLQDLAKLSRLELLDIAATKITPTAIPIPGRIKTSTSSSILCSSSRESPMPRRR